MDADKHDSGGEWIHSAADLGEIVREFTKWADQPASLQHFAESTVRGRSGDVARVTGRYRWDSAAMLGMSLGRRSTSQVTKVATSPGSN